MFRILFILCIGIVLGFLLRKVPHIHEVDTTARYTIALLLFVFGIGIGSNHGLLHHIGIVGWQAFVIALLGMAGSFGAAYLFHNLLEKKEERDER